ncbi:MAG: hypothetical protein ACSHWW_13645 [Nonlabens sp.]|uniref:hypothetical protein n=1 Tax=Nonlabens sp. TaxID=1888209 RepID=UPI003EF85C1B
MNSTKYRGYQNLWKDINAWVDEYKSIDFETLEYGQREWVKVYIRPFSNISLSNNAIPQPRNKARRLITQGLIDIYRGRKEQLDQLGKPYYLKIWLCEHRFSQSQVVCAIDDCIDFYEITHRKPEKPMTIEKSGISDISSKYPEFTWEHRLDENLVDFNDLGTPDDYHNIEDYLEEKRWYDNLAKKKHIKIETPNSDTDYRAFKKGNVWIGEIK